MPAVPVVAQVPVAQYKVPILFFLPAVQANFVHDSWLVQQRASVVPVVPYFAGSLNFPVVQVTLAPPHLVASFSQQVAFSALVHEVPAQYVVA
jgi:hypothetical protein